MNPIYNPKGAAKEYCEWALNIYTGCPHRCFYCYSPQVLRRDKEDFFTRIEPRKNIVEETRKQLEREGIAGKLIQLCFIGDPYPTGYDTSITREIIQLLKQFGNHVQILTKGDGRRDFDLLDDGDWYGITMDCGKLNERTVGELFFFLQLACGISAYTLGVNPFDQPGVDAYKKNMFALLGKPGYETQKAELEAKLNR